MPLLADSLKNYPNRLFVETGTYLCEGILTALKSNFKQVISIELSPNLYKEAFIKFAFNPHVKIIHGDSAKVLPAVLKYIDEPVTFWLDGHYSAGITALGEVNSPLLFELEAIKKHHIKNHTILIDDLRCWINPVGNYDKSKSESNKFDTKILTEKLLEINPDYDIYCIDGHVPNDILVAKPK